MSSYRYSHKHGRDRHAGRNLSRVLNWVLQDESACDSNISSAFHSPSTTAVGSLPVYKLMVSFFTKPLCYVPVYAVLAISSYFELLSAVETFAWTFDVSSPLLYFLVVAVLPISLWFVLRMAFIRNHCPAHAYCKGLSLPADQSKAINWRLGFQFIISFLSAGVILVSGLLYGFRKVIRNSPIFKVTLTATNLPTEHVCLAFLIFQLQIVLHMLHMESTFAPKVSCPSAWKSRWRNLRTTVILLLTGLCLVGVFRVIRTLQNNRYYCWSSDDWKTSVTVAVLIVSSISATDYNGLKGAFFRFFLVAVSFKSLGDVDTEQQMLPAYEILLWSLATTLVHLILSTKLYEPSERPIILLTVMFLSNAVPLLLQMTKTCMPPSL